MTVKLLVQSSNGRHPVRTYWEVGLAFLKVETRTHLEDCHPNCPDIRAHRGELFLKTTSKPELIGKQ